MGEKDTSLADGITEHIWTVKQLLSYQVPLHHGSRHDEEEDVLRKSKRVFSAIFCDHT